MLRPEIIKVENIENSIKPSPIKNGQEMNESMEVLDYNPVSVSSALANVEIYKHL